MPEPKASAADTGVVNEGRRIPKRRIFVAIPIRDQAVRAHVTRIQQAMTQRMDGVEGWRATRPEDLHLTLQFVGDATENQCDRLKGWLDEVTHLSVPARLKLSGHGIFERKDGEGGAAWMGLAGQTELVHAMNVKVEDAVRKIVGQRHGFTPYRPHVTVGTVSNDAAAAAWRRHQPEDGPEFITREIAIFESSSPTTGRHRRRLSTHNLR